MILAIDADKNTPLLVNQFVDVELLLKPMDSVYLLPQSAVQNRHVWLIDQDNRLQQQPLNILWRDNGSVIARAFAAGEQELVLYPRASFVLAQRAKGQRDEQ